MLSILGQADLSGISQLSQYGLPGVMLLIMIYAVIAIWKQNTTNLVDWRVEARADLKEERSSRQAHEAAMTKLLAELVAQATEQKDAMSDIRAAMDRTAQAMDQTSQTMVRVLEEIKRVQGIAK
jgi:uncharacterized coiled-coil DUF342 family protein